MRGILFVLIVFKTTRFDLKHYRQIFVRSKIKRML